MRDLLQNLGEDGGSIPGAIIDILIVFYLVYIFLLLVKGTRTVPMAVGLLLLVLLYTFSRQLGFATTYMLLDHFMSVVVIFTLIIFQEDIRRALVRFGRFAWFSKARETAVVEEVIRSAVLMSFKKIGALIVFEREALLDEFILEPGIRLDSHVSKELLYAVFIPMMENPLHDGAAVLRNYQIREAGAFFPLSTSSSLPKHMGTRHRAALGITELTDAVAIVVSEERGTISVCHRGKMYPDLDVVALRGRLLSIFARSVSTEVTEDSSSGDELDASADVAGSNDETAERGSRTPDGEAQR